MFSLLISILSIVLVGVLSAATILHISSTEGRKAEAHAGEVIHQVQTIHGAMEVFRVDRQAYPVSLLDLKGFVPTAQNPTCTQTGPSACVSYVSTLPTVSRAALENRELAGNWEQVTPGGRSFWLREQVSQEVCYAINRVANDGDGHIHAKADPRRTIQCYGEDAPFTTVFAPTGAILVSEVRPEEVDLEGDDAPKHCDPRSPASECGIDTAPEETPGQGTLVYGQSTNVGTVPFAQIVDYTGNGAYAVPRGNVLGTQTVDNDAEVLRITNEQLGGTSYTSLEDPELVATLQSYGYPTVQDWEDALVAYGMVEPDGVSQIYEFSVSTLNIVGAPTPAPLVRIGYRNAGTGPIELTSVSFEYMGQPVTDPVIATTQGASCVGQTLQPDALCSNTVVFFPSPLPDASQPLTVVMQDSSGNRYTTDLLFSIGDAQFVVTQSNGDIVGGTVLQDAPQGTTSFLPYTLASTNNSLVLPSIALSETQTVSIPVKNIGTVPEKAPVLTLNSSNLTPANSGNFGEYTLTRGADCELVQPGASCTYTFSRLGTVYRAPATSANPAVLVMSSPGTSQRGTHFAAILGGGTLAPVPDLTANQYVSSNATGLALTVGAVGGSTNLPPPQYYSVTEGCDIYEHIRYTIDTSSSMVVGNRGSAPMSVELISLAQNGWAQGGIFLVQVQQTGAATRQVQPGASTSIQYLITGELDNLSISNGQHAASATYRVPNVAYGRNGNWAAAEFSASIFQYHEPHQQVYQSLSKGATYKQGICNTIAGEDFPYTVHPVSSTGFVVSNNSYTPPYPVSSGSGTLSNVNVYYSAVEDQGVGEFIGEFQSIGKIPAVRLPLTQNSSQLVRPAFGNGILSIAGLPAGATLRYDSCGGSVTGSCRKVFTWPTSPQSQSYTFNGNVGFAGVAGTSKSVNFSMPAMATPAEESQTLLQTTVP